MADTTTTAPAWLLEIDPDAGEWEHLPADEDGPETWYRPSARTGVYIRFEERMRGGWHVLWEAGDYSQECIAESDADAVVKVARLTAAGAVFKAAK